MAIFVDRRRLFSGGGQNWITDFSYLRPFVPKNERSLWKTFVPRERKFQELSFPGPLVPGNVRSRGTNGTFVPRPFRSRELSFVGPFVHGNFRSHCLIGLVAALLWVLNYCMIDLANWHLCILHAESHNTISWYRQVLHWWCYCILFCDRTTQCNLKISQWMTHSTHWIQK